MPRVDANVVVAGDGAVYVAPEATAFPSGSSGLAAPASPWDDLGWFSEDGVTADRARTESDLNVWQSTLPIRKLITGAPITIAGTLRQFDPDTLIAALGGGTFTSGATAGTFVFPDPSDVSVVAMIIDGIDGAYTFRFLFERVQIGGDMQVPLKASDAMNLPVTFNVLASTNNPKIISNHPAWLT